MLGALKLVGRHDNISKRGKTENGKQRYHGTFLKYPIPEDKEGQTFRSNLLFYLARPERFELPTPWFVARYSIQLSYGRVKEGHELCRTR